MAETATAQQNQLSSESNPVASTKPSDGQPVLFRKRTKVNARLRNKEDVLGGDEESEAVDIVKPTEKRKRINVATTGSGKKWKTAERSVPAAVEGVEDHEQNGQEESSARDVNLAYESSLSAVAAGPEDLDATRSMEIDDKEKMKRENAKKTGWLAKFGPKAATGSVRISCRFDYQPDICKDYKETGFCGYGDACIFLHDRGDYKTGWQLEKEWEDAQKLKAEGVSVSAQDFTIKEDEEDGLPFACFICREDFVNPVVTRCGHYFCEKCALERNSKKKTCAVCDLPTNGIFNRPTKLLSKLKEREQRLLNK